MSGTCWPAEAFRNEDAFMLYMNYVHGAASISGRVVDL
jgi:hypothetical protein